jgi:enoyl-CoA hydratase/carnithine racemase
MTFAWAKEMTKTSKYGIYMAKQVFYSQVEMTEWQAYNYAKEMMAMAGVSVNSTEGFSAFMGNRKPVWDESTVF